MSDRTCHRETPQRVSSPLYVPDGRQMIPGNAEGTIHILRLEDPPDEQGAS